MMPGRAFRLALLCPLLIVAACSTTTPTTTAPTRDSGPVGQTPDLSNLPDPIPHTEPPSKYGNKSPYEVLGKTYYVLPNPENYKETAKPRGTARNSTVSARPAVSCTTCTN